MTVKNKQGSRIFKSPILEALTFTNVPLHIGWYLGISVGLVLIGYFDFFAKINEIIVFYIGGLITWSFIEYCLHRFLFHVVLENRILQKVYYALHGVHHDYPLEEKRTFMPPLPGTLFAITFLGIFYISMGHDAFFFDGGIALGYLFYSTLHHAIHIYRAPKLLRPLWTHHLLHHYQQPNKAFGVTSTLWDRVFGTMPDKKIQKVN